MSRGEHRPGYKRPKTGEARRVRQHFRIDALPQEVRERIRSLRAEGKTWQQISDLSIDFSPRRLSLTLLHRWYDVRVEQQEKPANALDVERLASLVADRILERLEKVLSMRAA